MSSEVRTGTIFISHASSDIEQASEIYERLKEKEYPVWMAVHEVKPGANYADIIIKTLDAAKAVIVLLSKDSIASDHVKREISLASELGLLIYPVTFTDLNNITSAFEGDWKNWFDVSKIYQYYEPRDAAKSLSNQLDIVFDLSNQKVGLDKQTMVWIENASTLLSTLLAIPESKFDFIGFNNEMHQEIGYQIPQLAKSLNQEGKIVIGEFLYSCYWSITTLRPEWVPDDPRLQQMLYTNYLIPSSMQFYFPEAMNSLAFRLLESDINLFVDWVEEKYYFDEVMERSNQVGVSTPINLGDDPDGKRTSNTLGFLIFSTGLKLFGFFYSAKRSPDKIEEAIDWLKEFESAMSGKDLDYLEEICPTPSFKIWLPMIRLFSAFFEYKSGSISSAKRLLGKLSDSKLQEFQILAHSQTLNMNLADEYRDCWLDLESMVEELKVTE